MTSPTVIVGMWDRDRSSTELLRNLCRILHAKGAQFSSEGDSFASFTGLTPLDIDGVDITVGTHQPNSGAGGLLDMSIAAGELDIEPPEKWWPLRDALVEIILAVDPMIANIALDVLPYDLPEVAWQEAQELFASGWVNLERCTPTQRQTFLHHHDHGFGSTVGHGLWWGTADFELTPTTLSAGTNQAMAYAAWMEAQLPTVERAPESAEPPSDTPPPPPQLWFWRPDLIASDVNQLIRHAVEHLNVDHAVLWDQYGPAWATAVVWLKEFNPDRLQLFRQLIELVRPRWAGILPMGTDIAIGFPTGDFAISTPITELWVDRAWIGESLGELDAILTHTHREETLDGILWVADKSLAPDLPYPTRWNGTTIDMDRAMRVSLILSKPVQQSVVEMYGELPT